MITLVLIHSCHAKDNVVFENLTEQESAGIRKLAKREGYLVAERKAKPQEPTCDNCGHMTIRQNRDGENYRRCLLRGQVIPDNEQSPSCDFHTALQRFEDIVTGRRKGQRKENTFKKGGAL